MKIAEINWQEIASISDFLEDRINQNYGFTLILRDGSIRNFFVKGKYRLNKTEINQLKTKFQLISKTLQQNSKHKN